MLRKIIKTIKTFFTPEYIDVSPLVYNKGMYRKSTKQELEDIREQLRDAESTINMLGDLASDMKNLHDTYWSTRKK